MSLILLALTGSPTITGTMWVVDGMAGSRASSKIALSRSALACSAPRSGPGRPARRPRPPEGRLEPLRVRLLRLAFGAGALEVPHTGQRAGDQHRRQRGGEDEAGRVAPHHRSEARR